MKRKIRIACTWNSLLLCVLVAREIGGRYYRFDCSANNFTVDQRTVLDFSGRECRVVRILILSAAVCLASTISFCSKISLKYQTERTCPDMTVLSLKPLRRHTYTHTHTVILPLPNYNYYVYLIVFPLSGWWRISSSDNELNECFSRRQKRLITLYGDNGKYFGAGHIVKYYILALFISFESIKRLYVRLECATFCNDESEKEKIRRQ